MISTGDHDNFYPLREHSPGGRDRFAPVRPGDRRQGRPMDGPYGHGGSFGYPHVGAAFQAARRLPVRKRSDRPDRGGCRDMVGGHICPPYEGEEDRRLHRRAGACSRRPGRPLQEVSDSLKAHGSSCGLFLCPLRQLTEEERCCRMEHTYGWEGRSLWAATES